MARERLSGMGVDGAAWTFLSNHAHVLLCVAQDPGVRLREVAQKVGITERAVQRIIADLEHGGYLTRARSGRRNLYEVHPSRPLRHPIEAHREVRELLRLVLTPGEVRDLAMLHHPEDPRGSSAPAAIPRRSPP